MTIKKEVEYITKETFGPEGLPITTYLINKENISEFVIAKDLNIEIHRVRQILYKLLEDNIVVFNRKKDKIKGWYICYWSLNEQEFPYISKKIKNQKLDKLKERHTQETNDDYFMCKNACTRMNFDESFELNFKCPDCGEIMHQQNNERTLAFLKEKIQELEKELEKPLIRKPIKLIQDIADNQETGLVITAEDIKKRKLKDEAMNAKYNKKPMKKQMHVKKPVVKKKETKKEKPSVKKEKKPKKKVVKKLKSKQIKKKVIKKTTSKKEKKKKFSLFTKKKK